MQKVTQTQFRKMLDQLKILALEGKDFQQPLDAFYARLQITRQDEWILKADKHLRLLVPPEQHFRLNRPAVVQALYNRGFCQKARRMESQAHTAATAKTPLRPYTPLIQLSKYAGKTAPHAKNLYARQRAQLKKLPPRLSAPARRDFKELTDNYAAGNYKSVIILAGSLLEILLIARLQTLRLARIPDANPGRHAPKPLLEANLNDLLRAAEEFNLLPRTGLRLTRAARICRNLVHPGLELSARQTVNANKAEICFLSVLETLDAFIPLPADKL